LPRLAVAMLLLFRLVAACSCFAEARETPAGVFAGTAVRIVEEMGDPKLVPGEVAECVLSRDGRFRLAAALPGGRLLWTRGTWRSAGGNDAGTDLSFRCDDLSGTLEGRREGRELFLKFSPRPFETQAFRMSLRAPAVASGEGWPAEAARTAAVNGAGIYLCDAFASMAPAEAGRARAGQGVLALESDGRLRGGILAPGAGQKAGEPVLCPVGGRWRLSEGRLVIEPSWGMPRPATAWRDLVLQSILEEGMRVATGQTSLGGLPADGCRLEAVSPLPDAETAVPGRLALSGLGAVAQISGAPPWTKDILPIRIAADRRFLYLRAPDDPQTWLAFPLQVGPDGGVAVNVDGRCGYLVRDEAGEGWAFVLRSPPRSGADPHVPSNSAGDLWLITLDLHWQPIGAPRGRAGCFCRLLLAARSMPEDPLDERTVR